MDPYINSSDHTRGGCGRVMNFNREMRFGMVKKRVCPIGARIAKEPKRAIGIGKGGVETKRQDPNGNG